MAVRFKYGTQYTYKSSAVLKIKDLDTRMQTSNT